VTVTVGVSEAVGVGDIVGVADAVGVFVGISSGVLDEYPIQ